MGEKLKISKKHYAALAVVFGFSFVESAVASGFDAGFNPNKGLQLVGFEKFGALAKSYLALDQSALIKSIRDNDNDLKVLSQIQGEFLQTTRFQHTYKGLDVLGAQTQVHSLVGVEPQLLSNLRKFDLDIQPSVSPKQAVSLSLALANSGAQLVSPPKLEVLQTPEGASRLIYFVEFKSEPYRANDHDYIFDAHSGELVAEIPHQLNLRYNFAPVQPTSSVVESIAVGVPAKTEVDVYDATSAPASTIDPVSGAPLRVDLSSISKVIENSVVMPVGKDSSRTADDSALRALGNSAQVLKYFRTKHLRKGFDGKGSKAVNVVHVGKKYSNAFWNRKMKIMAYGDGDSVVTRDFTHAVDVAGHEMTHGVITSTSNLLFFGESGALNEAYSDFFGKVIENKNNWILGNGVFAKASDRATNGVRNLENPAALSVNYREEGVIKSKPYPRLYTERFISKNPCGTSNDYCWVHANATVIGHAGYLIQKKLGIKLTEKIFYTVMTQYLVPSSGFRHAAESTVHACKMLLANNKLGPQACDDVKQIYTDLGFDLAS